MHGEFLCEMASVFPSFGDSMCVICRVPFCNSADSDVSEVSRGLDRLIEYSEKLRDIELHSYLLTKPKVVRVHNSCRRNYTSKRRFDQKSSKDNDAGNSAAQQKSLRSSTSAFDWKINCFLCGQLCVARDGNADVKKIRRVMTKELMSSVNEQCLAHGDAWGLEVQSRLMTCHCLIAEEAVYHKNCHRSFNRVVLYSNSGRPVDGMKGETFEKLCDWLEVNDFELLTLQDVVNKARVVVPNNDSVYSDQWLKQKLIERYGDHIQFCEVRGRRNVICWKEMGSYIINQKWHDDQKDNQNEHLMITAAKLLKTAIRKASYDMEMYPSCSDIQDPQHVADWMPGLLRVFLDHLICPEGKKIALGHNIVQAVRPRSVIAPIPFAVGVSLDHICGSQYLLKLLNRLGMSVSYDEVYCFKQSVAQYESADPLQSFPECFTQFVADNVDHDVCTLDGKGTLHAMGIISIGHFGDDKLQQEFTDMPVPRMKRVRATALANVHRTPLLQCHLPKDLSPNITFKSGSLFTQPLKIPWSVNLDTLWHIGWFFQYDDKPRTS